MGTSLPTFKDTVRVKYVHQKDGERQFQCTGARQNPRTVSGCWDKERKIWVHDPSSLKLILTCLLLALASGCGQQQRLSSGCQQVFSDCKRDCYDQCESGAVRKRAHEQLGPQQSRITTNNWSTQCNNCRTQCNQRVKKCQSKFPIEGATTTPKH